MKYLPSTILRRIRRGGRQSRLARILRGTLYVKLGLAAGLEVRNPNGHLVLRSPAAVVSIDAKSLLTGTLQPRAIEFRDLQVRAALNRDGSLSFVAAEGSEPQAVTSPPAGGAADQGP